MRKIEREYARAADQCGVKLRRMEARNGHIALYFDAGTIFAAGTPSDRRNRANLIAQIRRLHKG